MKTKLIFIVEDHPVIRDGVKKYLENSGYGVLAFGNIATAREAISKKKPDLLIQDIMLPDGDGFEFVQEVRKNADVPVIFMTAKIAEEDRIHGFELGADDYITKPFSPKELVLRVQAVFRRLDASNSSTSDAHALGADASNIGASTGREQAELVFKVGDGILRFNDFKHTLTLNGQNVYLTSAEWRIFKMLIENASAIISRSEILEKCFGYTSLSYERIADTHIKNLRAKLGKYPWIETVRGYGYRFIAFKVDDEKVNLDKVDFVDSQKIDVDNVNMNVDVDEIS